MMIKNFVSHHDTKERIRMLKKILTSLAGVMVTFGISASAFANSTPPTNHIISHVPIIAQLPQLKNGCEVTSMAMLLNYYHIHVSKMTLAKQIVKDPTPLEGSVWDIKRWGNPNVGFVGNIYTDPGYGVYHHPLMQLAKQYVGNRAIDLTRKPFFEIEGYLAKNDPVLVIASYDFEPFSSGWETYTDEYHKKTTINMEEHAVLLVGYDKTHLWVNNPLNGEAYQEISLSDFLQAWKQFGSQAITIVPAKKSYAKQRQ